MMKKIKYTLLFLLISPYFLLAARGPEENKSKNNNQQQVGLAAGCTPASRIIFLEFNNVRTRVEAGGLWWQDRPNGQADYEVPVNSNSFALFAGGLWLAGTDVNGQLKAAASLFGNGVDFWTGPLDTSGTAEITERTCEEYDRFFEISRADVAQFVAYNTALENGEDVDELFPDYQIPNTILDWPGNGNTSIGQDFLLAPYVNVGGDISYEPSEGDYPKYDLEGTVDCRANREDRSESSLRPLFGDQTYWWIFNDKGNLHTETNAPSIGMEIHGQAFAFATNDAINDMTFYNFELINRSTFTLTDTYFASYVDPDLGNPSDDYVGCDVGRGLGFCYNGDQFDEDFRGQTGYGSTPAAIGIDFFEGPYQDADGINNDYGVGPGEALNGLGYFNPNDRNPDTVIDNERFGMRRFVYYNIGTAQNGDPSLAIHYYNYMRGIWKNGQRMRHGGNGFNSAAVENIVTDFMFPGDSDPLHWGTTNSVGITTIPDNTNWTEDNPGAGEQRNNEGDRRFLQSAGPFTLRPGNVNDITVGVVFAQAESGGRLASVDKLFLADDKAQALFDNCFQVLSGPDAPKVDVQELNNELIFYISNPETSNNREEFGEPYVEEDPNIVTPDFLANQQPPIFYDNEYRFQGYQVYQLSGPGISVNDVEDPSKARLVFQCDIRDDVADLVNFTFDEELNANVPTKKVVAANEGIKRSFSLRQDLFATGNNELVNYKTYYYLAISYGYNEFKPYLQGTAPDSANPFAPAFDGQTAPYISSRKGPSGGSVNSFTAIPHNPTSESGGTVVSSNYGDEIGITRLQGRGNGGQEIRIATSSLDKLFNEKAWEDPNKVVGEIDYVAGDGPFSVEVVDPLNVIDGTFYLQILDETFTIVNSDTVPVVTDSAEWKVWLDGGTASDTVYSNKSIATENEQLLFSPNWGLSVTIQNGIVPGSKRAGTNNGFISASIIFDEPENDWLSGIPDTDFEGPTNWILAGTVGNSPSGLFNDYFNNSSTNFVDPEEHYESILGGIIAPYRLTRYESQNELTRNAVANSKIDIELSALSKLNSIVIFITNDKSKWTRCPVIETGEDNPSEGVIRGKVKEKLSVDKEGNPVDTAGFGGTNLAVIDTLFQSTNENSAGFAGAVGMGWFPGYVFNKETGERLNMAFGEDSRYSFNNGNDMIWNPNSELINGIPPNLNNVWGGKHFVYIFRETLESEKNRFPPSAYMPQYDNGATLKRILSNSNGGLRRFGWGSCMWASVPFLTPGQELLSTNVRIDVNVSKPFATKDSPLPPSLDNNTKPVYRFETDGVAVKKGVKNALQDHLTNINVVPNPYYAISEYETSQLDNTVKFINLPEVCTIKIYNTNGTLIRTYNKSDPNNFLDWSLTNQAGIPISSGVYIIHIDVPNVGEKILKWFGVVRPVDLNNF